MEHKQKRVIRASSHHYLATISGVKIVVHMYYWPS